MTTKKSYMVIYELDEEGWWVATVKGLQGVHTQARTIERARARIREALEAAGVETEEIELRDDVKLPAKVQNAILLARGAREEAEHQQERAQAALRAAARVLTQSVGLSVRDAAELLGISFQRVHQLTEKHT